MARKTGQNTGFIMSMAILASLFGIIGLLSWLNSILIPYFKVACQLNHTQSYFVALAFYIAYLVMSVPASKFLDRFGYKRGMVVGLWFMSLGTFIFIPAAYLREYGVFLLGLFTIGTGLSILQTAVNPYVTIIGPINSASRRISIMGLANKSAGIVAPLIFAAVVLKSSDSALFEQLNANLIVGAQKEAVLDELIRRVIEPYAVLSAFLFLFGIAVAFSGLPEIKNSENASDAIADDDSSAPDFDERLESSSKIEKGKILEKTADRKSVFAYPYLILGALAIFFHVSSQVIAVDTIIGYAQTMGFDLNSAKIFPSITLGCTLLGYILGIILIPKIVSQKRMFQLCVLLGTLLSLCVIFMPFDLSIFDVKIKASILFLCMLGFPNALIYAGIWPLAIRGLGKWTNLGSSLMVMALSGNALMPVFYGIIADMHDLHTGYSVLIICFIYLIFYAFYGYKIENWKDLCRIRK